MSKGTKREGGDTMKDPEIDRILSAQDEILPSSGFTASVMEAVRREASAPPPIPFPWKRALPVLLLAVFAMVLILVVGVAVIAQSSKEPLAPQLATSWPSVLTLLPQGVLGTAVGWTALALLLTFVSVKVSMRLAAPRV